MTPLEDENRQMPVESESRRRQRPPSAGRLGRAVRLRGRPTDGYYRHAEDPLNRLDPKPTWGRRLVGIEGLRGAAAMSVLLGHVSIHLDAKLAVNSVVQKLIGTLGEGLTLFFCLSGFLLYRPFATSVLSGSVSPSVRRYLVNRFLRIYPAYMVIFCLVSFVFGLAYVTSVPELSGVSGADGTLGRMTSPLAIINNLFLVHTLVPSTLKTGLGVSWSLTVEICFYFSLPLLYLAARYIGRRTSRLLAAFSPGLLLVVIGTVCRLVASRADHGTTAHIFFEDWGANWHAVIARSLLAQADLFGFGMIAAAVLVGLDGKSLAVVTRRRLRWSILIFGAVVAGGLRFDRDGAYAVFFSTLIIFVLTPTTIGRLGTLPMILEWRVFRWLGLISYSVYLWHVPVIWFVARRSWSATGNGLSALLFNFLVVAAITIFLSSITYRFVELPGLRLKTRFDGTSSHRRRRQHAASEDNPR